MAESVTSSSSSALFMARGGCSGLITLQSSFMSRPTPSSGLAAYKLGPDDLEGENIWVRIDARAQFGLSLCEEYIKFQ